MEEVTDGLIDEGRDTVVDVADPHYSTAQVVALTGATHRQLQWYDEQGVVVPSREDNIRLYSVNQLFEVALIIKLRKRGVSLQQIRGIQWAIRSQLAPAVPALRAGTVYYALTGGKSFSLYSSAEAVLLFVMHERGPIVGVELRDVTSARRRGPARNADRAIDPAKPHCQTNVPGNLPSARPASI